MAALLASTPAAAEDAGPAGSEQVAALCAEAEAAPDETALAAFEDTLDGRIGLDHAAYEAAAQRSDAADGAYFGLLRKLADAIQARMAEAWSAARTAEQALADAPAGEGGVAVRAAAQAALDEARATLDGLSQQFAATPAEQALAVGVEMVEAYDSAVVEQAAARDAMAALEAARAPLIAIEAAVAPCIARRRQALQAEAAAVTAAPRDWTGEGTYAVRCRNASFDHTGRVRVTRRADGGLAVELLVPPERGGGVVSLDGAMDGMGGIAVAQNLSGVLWLLDGALMPRPGEPGRLQGAGTGRFANPMQNLDCTMEWQTDP